MPIASLSSTKAAALRRLMRPLLRSLCAGLRPRSLVLTIVAVVLALGSAHLAHAQRAQVRVEQKIYASLPFVLLVSAEGFDTEPEPEISPFEIPGCKITFMGVVPNVSTSISIINGRRSESRRVEFVYRYRVEAPAPGTYRVPVITVTQGDRQAKTRAATFQAAKVAATRDMRLTLSLPQRPIWVGETFDVGIAWDLRRDPEDQSFSIPLLNMPEWIDVHGSNARDSRRALLVPAGDRELELPFRSDKTADGFTRIGMNVVVTATKPGTIDVPPAQVVAALQVGTKRGPFSFRVAQTQLFKAEDRARQLEIRPLPLADRPPSFAGAVGTAYSLQLQASRTVVRVGDPIELSILVRGDGRLEGLSLPPLDNEQGLPAEIFAVPEAGSIPGEIIDVDSGVGGANAGAGGGKGKRFVVTVRLKNAEAREIPSIGFAYFDPSAGEYRTVFSEPVALSVAGSAVVGAGDVVSGAAGHGGPSGVDTPVTEQAGGGSAAVGAVTTGAATASRAGLRGFVGADLSLSRPADTLGEVRPLSSWMPLILALYILPVILLAGQIWRSRTSARRDHSGEIKRALKQVRRAVEEAGQMPAREAAPNILNAMGALAKCTGERPKGAILERLETESFRREAAQASLEADVCREVLALADAWARAGRSRGADSHRGADNRAGSEAGARAGKNRQTALMLLVLAPGLCQLMSSNAAWAQERSQTASSSVEPPAPSAGGGSPTEPRNAGNPDIDGAGGPHIDAEAELARARELYQGALADDDLLARMAGFARAEAIFRDVLRQRPGRPELLTDWGNAALGAQELGWATLAYRRALALDPGLRRAERNLAWARARAPDWLPQPASNGAGAGAGATATLFFWHGTLSVTTRHVVAACAFAVALFCWLPWSSPRRRLWRRLSIAPALLWLAMFASAMVDDNVQDQAVVVTDGVPLLSADSGGAPPALPQPLPAGAEVRVLETRDLWSRVMLADGTRGWMQRAAVVTVEP